MAELKRASTGLFFFFFASPKKKQILRLCSGGAPQSITSRLWVGSLIKLQCYCGLYIGNSTLRVSRSNKPRTDFNSMHTHLCCFLKLILSLIFLFLLSVAEELLQGKKKEK